MQDIANSPIIAINDACILSLIALPGALRAETAASFDYDELIFTAQEYLKFPYSVKDLMDFLSEYQNNYSPSLLRFLSAICTGAALTAEHADSASEKEGYQALSTYLSHLMQPSEAGDNFPESHQNPLWMEQAIRDCINTLGSRYAIRTEYFRNLTYASVYYDSDLIIDNLRDLSNTAGILETAKRYEQLKARLAGMGVTLLCIKKEPWKNDRTKYLFTVRYKGSTKTLFSYINYSERLLHELPDCFPNYELMRFILLVDYEENED